MVVALATLALPVVAFRAFFSGLGREARDMGALGLTIAMWIIWFYFISLLSLPANTFVWLPLIGAIVWIFRKREKLVFSKSNIDWHLVMVLLAYASAFFFSDMLPGCDTSMHGYITRLIIEQNGLPNSYQPLIPDHDFGAYASGFHLLAAMFAMFNSGYLLDGLSMSTAVAYFIGITGLFFLLTNFTNPAYAWLSSLVSFWFHASLQSSVTWGGSPTVLSLGLVFFACGFIGYSFKYRSMFFMACAAFLWIASVLTHPIPAYIGVYVVCVIAIYWILLFRLTTGFVWRSAGLFVCITGMMLLPFIGAFTEQSSGELSKMIAQWQSRMMGGVFSGDLFNDLLPVLGQIKTGIGDLILISSAFFVLCLMIIRKHKALLFVAVISLLLFVIVLNAGYWLLPFSELLYPERAVYFYVVPFGILLAFAANEWMVFRNQGRYKYGWVIGLMLFVVALFNFQNRYWQKVVFSERLYDGSLMEAFAWIENHTEQDAVFHTNYDTEGMWIPALSYRATIGTHLHFIHELDRVFDGMCRLPVDHYEFRLTGLTPTPTGIDSLADRREVVFKNSRVEVVHTRKRAQ